VRLSAPEPRPGEAGQHVGHDLLRRLPPGRPSASSSAPSTA